MFQTPRVIPCLLLDGERLVKTQQFADPDYVGDPVNVLSIFNSFEVDEIVLLDIAAAASRESTPIARLAHYAEECYIPLAYGGGLEDLRDVEQVFGAGYEKVVLNTVVADRPDFVREAAAMFGSQAIVVGIDVREMSAGYRVFVRGGREDTGEDPVGWARRAESLGAGELLVTSIDREGSMSGYDLELVQMVAESVGVPVVAHGGAGKRKDLATPLGEAGAHAVAAGSIFVYQGRSRGVLINYPSRRQVEKLP